LRNPLEKLAPRDLWFALSACTTGSAVVFALFTPVNWVAKIVVLVSGLILAIAYHVMWWKSKKQAAQEEQEIVVHRELVYLDPNGSAEITFAPPAPIINPKLVLSAHGRPVKVEDIWHAGVSVMTVPRSIRYWNQGVVYSGHIDANQPLKILLINEGFAPATVRASIVVSKE
jgi:hypothetical protein